LGIYAPTSPGDDFAASARFHEVTGTRLALAMWFQAWGDDDAAFRADLVRQAARQGLTPIITWEPWRRDFTAPEAVQPRYTLTSIADGEHDEYVRGWARAAAKLNLPIVIRFAHEATTAPGQKLWYPWQGEPAEYRRAFRHIVEVFRAERAYNVSFAFTGMWLDEYAVDYYPGDDVVDLVGTTVLNHGTAPTVPGARWRPFRELFDAQYRAAQRWDKPLLLTEVASAEQGGDKAEWLTELFASLPRDYRQVAGVVLLEANDREWSTIDWSVASSPASLEAFRRATQATAFR
jgi:beta-mannanase